MSSNEAWQELSKFLVRLHSFCLCIHVVVNMESTVSPVKSKPNDSCHTDIYNFHDTVTCIPQKIALLREQAMKHWENYKAKNITKRYLQSTA